MAKNIIVCADGTGNKGGSTPDSNVYKIYKSINKYFKGQAQDGFEIDEQIVFYDNGVGTETNKYLRALGGGLGIGFEENVCDLYRFLARNYEDGDRIYFFGFSRGASTVRACNGFISICGLAKGKGLQNSELNQLVGKFFAAYKGHKQDSGKAAEKIKENRDISHGAIDIHFMGIWDTVVALGFPKRTDVVGPGTVFLNSFSYVAEKLLSVAWPHSFYYYKLTNNVKHAYQALSIDDERTAFWPFVWDEKGRSEGVVEQVWFPGMHSNVGGGYGRSGLASIPLHWMMLRAEKSGLNFEADSVRKAVDDGHIHGRMHNSRHDFAAIYRYHPREIEKLCEGKLEGNIKFHRSVIERMEHRTANYAPGQIPGTFEIVTSDTNATPVPGNPGDDPEWKNIRAEIDSWVKKQKKLYDAMLTFLLFVLGSAFFLRNENVPPGGFEGKLAAFFDYLTPDFFDGLIKVAVADQPLWLLGAIALIAFGLFVRGYLSRGIMDARERLRHLVITQPGVDQDK